VRRRHDDGRAYLFLLNHRPAAATVAATGLDLLTGAHWPGRGTVPAGGAAVLRERT
jgi:beta-galactosidase